MVEAYRMALPRTLAALALAAAVSLAGAAPAALAGSIVPASGVYLGAFANEPGGITTLETAIGRNLALDRTYVPWTFTGWANRAVKVLPLLNSMPLRRPSGRSRETSPGAIRTMENR